MTTVTLEIEDWPFTKAVLLAYESIADDGELLDRLFLYEVSYRELEDKNRLLYKSSVKSRIQGSLKSVLASDQ
jgi:hypothetical protein